MRASSQIHTIPIYTYFYDYKDNVLCTENKETKKCVACQTFPINFEGPPCDFAVIFELQLPVWGLKLPSMVVK